MARPVASLPGMVTNVSFALLDGPVIAGRGEDPVVGTLTHARLLEEVAALGGVLAHLGVAAGVPVVVDLADDDDAVVAALAATRIGGVVSTADDPAAPVVLVSAGSSAPADGRVRIVRGESVADPDLEWDAMIRAGRTDPAACEVLDPDAAYSPERSVAEQIELIAGTQAPYEASELRGLLGV
jgi:hypothetical protein